MKAGAFRFTKYGLETRTLSNFPLKSEKLLGWVFDQTNTAIDYVNDDILNKPLVRTEGLGKKVFEAITNNDLKLAEKIVKELRIPLPEVEVLV